MMANVTKANGKWSYLEYMVKMGEDKEKQSSDAHRSHDEGLDDMSMDPDAHLTAAEKDEADRKLVWKLDMNLIPWLCFLYLLAFLDRTNIGNAKVAGLEHDLKLDSASYNATLTIFFVSYAVFEPLTNVLLKKMNPSRFIPITMILWGACMLSMGFVKNWSGLMAARWFLGLTEAGLFPGVNYYLSCWYKREELGVRCAIFFSAAALSGSFGGLLAAAIEKMDGTAGLPGWAWIFILEGLLTVVVGIASFWMVYDFPQDARFLSEEDRARVLYRLKGQAQHEDFETRYIWDALKDWKTWLGMAIYMGCDMPLYAFSLFLPSIIDQLGWGKPSVRAQLLSVPPYAVATVLTVIIGFVADRTRRRGLCNILTSAIGIVGFAMILGSNSAAVKYTGTFLGAMGIYPCIANTITWVANNTEGVYKRGIVLGMVIGWGNLNGIVSSNIYLGEEKLRGYPTGHSTVLAYMALFLFGGSILMTLLLGKENRARDRGERDNLMHGIDQTEMNKLGDQRPTFRYTV